MRELFLEFAKHGAMTKEQLAQVLQVDPDWVRREAKAGRIPRIPHVHWYRFDPLKMIEVFCEPLKPDRSLTTEKRKTSGNQSTGGFRKCL